MSSVGAACLKKVIEDRDFDRVYEISDLLPEEIRLDYYENRRGSKKWLGQTLLSSTRFLMNYVTNLTVSLSSIENEFVWEP